MEMNTDALKLALSQYSHLTLPKQKERETVALVLGEYLGEVIEIERVTINRNTAHVRLTAVQKQEMVLNQEALLLSIQKKMEDKSISALR